MYKSKNEIYDDYQIAIKLGIDYKIGGFGNGSYQELYNILSKDHHGIIKELEWSIENFNSIHPHSTGVFVEIPVDGKNGKEIGVRYIFLQHETGLEVFVKVVEFVSENTLEVAGAMKITKKIYELVAEKSLKKLMTILTRKWDSVMRHKIYFVEIRTRDKGVMRLQFDDFKVLQLKCLINKFGQIHHLSEVNQSCFEGKLIDPPSASPLSDD